jgi:uncharacterized protein YjbJ (UPF0337 family)
MKSSTRDKVEGAVKEATGKLKEKIGKATGDPRMRPRGTAEKVCGKVQRKVGDIKRVFGGCARLRSTVCCTSVSFAMNVSRCIYREISRYLRDCKPPDFSDFRKRLRSPSLRRPSGSSEFRDVARASLK